MIKAGAAARSTLIWSRIRTWAALALAAHTVTPWLEEVCRTGGVALVIEETGVVVTGGAVGGRKRAFCAGRCAKGARGGRVVVGVGGTGSVAGEAEEEVGAGAGEALGSVGGRAGEAGKETCAAASVIGKVGRWAVAGAGAIAGYQEVAGNAGGAGRDWPRAC